MSVRTLLRWSARGIGIVLAVILLFMAGAVWWVGQSTSFLRWSLDRAAAASGGAFHAGAVHGTLAGGFRLESLQWADDTIELRLERLAVSLRPDALLRGELRVSRVNVEQVQILLKPGDEAAAPAALPASFGLPIDVRVDALQIGRLTIGQIQTQSPPSPRAQPTAPPAEPIALEDVSLAARYRDGAYRIERFAVVSPQWGEASLRGVLGDRAPFTLAFVLEAAPRMSVTQQPLLSLPRVRALADGTLEDFALVAQALPPPGFSEGVWIGADTRVRAFAQTLSDRLEAVEIAFNAVEPSQFGLQDVPQARLSGHATLRLRDGGVAGTFRVVNGLPGAIDRNAVPLRTLRAEFDFASPVLSFRDLQATLPGEAQIDGALSVDFAHPLEVFGQRVPLLQGGLGMRDIDLAQLQTHLEKTRIGGEMRVDREQLDVDVVDESRDDIGLSAALRVDGSVLRIERAQLRTPAGALRARGSVTGTAPYRVELSGDFTGLDPAGVEALLARFDVLDEAVHLQDWAGKIGGQWNARGQVWPELQLETALAVESGSLAGEALRLQWRATVAMTRISLVAATLDFGGAQARFDGSLGRSGDRLRFSVKADALRRFDARASGSASAEGELRGGWHDAALGLVGQISARRLAWDDWLRVDSLTGSVDVADLSKGRIELDFRASQLVAPGRRLDRLSARVEGDIGAQTIRIDASGPDLSARVSAQGGVAEEDAGGQWRWDGRLDAVDADAPVALHLERAASVRIDATGVLLGESSWRVDGAPLNVSTLAWRDGEFATRGDASGLPVGRWLRRFASETSVAGESAEAELESFLLDAQWDLHGDQPARPSGRLQLALRNTADKDQRGDVDLRLEEGRLGGQVDLRIPTLAFANRIIGPAWAVSGRLHFSGELGGTIAEPRVHGTLDGDSLTLLQRELGWRLTDGVLEGQFDGDRLVLRRLRLESGDGSITMSGALRLEGLRGGFELRADALPVPLGPGEQLVVSGVTTITSRGAALQWSGALRVDEGLIELRGGDAPSLPGDVVIVAEEPQAVPAPKAAQADGLRVAADLTLDLGEKLRIRGSGVDVWLAGSLELKGTLPENPLARGTVRVARGTYSAYGQELQITRGRVIFDGPIDNPVLDIVAMRPGGPVEAGVAVTGTVLSPRVNLVSKPEVPDAEKLSWLVLGVGFDDARSGAQIAVLRAAAASLIGSNGGGSGGLVHSLGLDVLTIRSASAGDIFDPDFGATFSGQNATGASSAGASQDVLAVGKRLSSRVLVTYEQGLRGIWNLLRIQYEITDRLSVRAQTGTDTALDLLYSFTFD